jgi:hypothetical protein
LINAQEFQESFLLWQKQIVELLPEEVVAIDGKSIRASRRVQKGLRALHVVSAWSCTNGISLGQPKVDDKTNEISVIPELLKNYVSKGPL